MTYYKELMTPLVPNIAHAMYLAYGEVAICGPGLFKAKTNLRYMKNVAQETDMVEHGNST